MGAAAQHHVFQVSLLHEFVEVIGWMVLAYLCCAVPIWILLWKWIHSEPKK